MIYGSETLGGHMSVNELDGTNGFKIKGSVANVGLMAQKAEEYGSHDKTFEIRYGGHNYTFECLECAIHRLAPQCAHCGCRVIGHGVEADGVIYCCAHCTRAHGQTEVRDRVDHG